MDTSYLIEVVRTPLTLITTPSDRFFWLYLITALLVAVAVLWRRMRPGQRDVVQVLADIFPKDVYFHPSTRIDLGFVFVKKVFFFMLVTPILLSTGVIAEWLYTFYSTIASPLQYEPTSVLVASVIVTVLALLVVDMVLYITHYLQHTIPWLWEFHKVHHSAEVLTPITVYRMHPVDDLLGLFLITGLSGALYSVILFVFASPPDVLLVSGLNVFFFLFYLFGYNLRHTHIWVSYGQFWEQIIISPAQHQIHHSVDKAHHDKNFGFMLAVWDRWAGTLVIPTQPFNITFGLGDESREYRSVWQLFVTPFKKVAKLHHGKK